MNTKDKVISNMVWRLFERFGAQGVSFIVSVILARLLDPSVYGTIALVTAFTTVLQIFVDSGMASSLIQKKEADDLDFSTVFYFNLFFCFILYTIMFFVAPVIASFYRMKELTSIIRVMCLTLIISGVKNVQQAFVSRNLMFKRFFWATIGGTIGAAIIGIWMACRGYGIWALVTQNIFNQTVDTVILWITVKWRPKLLFSFERLKSLFSFGWKLLAARLVEALYSELRSLVIGKKYSTSDLAFYNRGEYIPKLIIGNIDITIESVLFPVIASVQDNKEKVKEIQKKSLKINTYIIDPILVGFSVCAESIIRLILTEKWLPCIPYVRIFCFVYCFTVFNTSNMNAYRAIGRSDIYLKVEIIRKAVGFVILFISMWISPFAIAMSCIVYIVIEVVIDTFPNKNLIGYSLVEQIKDALPAMIFSIAMGIPVYCVNLFNISPLITLIIQLFLGMTIYLALSVIFKPYAYLFIVGFIKEKVFCRPTRISE